MASELDIQAVLIRDAIVSISEALHTSARSVVDQYLRLISPSLANSGITSLPFTVMTKIGNEERYAPRSDRPMPCDVLCFHIGSTILAYYEAVREQRVTPTLERRTDFLHRVAKLGMSRMTVGGNERVGYYLSEPSLDNFMDKRYNAVSVTTPSQIPVVSNVGGGDSPDGLGGIHGPAGSGKID